MKWKMFSRQQTQGEESVNQKEEVLAEVKEEPVTEPEVTAVAVSE